jgi:chromate reductase
VLICTPEYVFILPGMLKNALEWTVSSTVFTHKPVALIVASAAGDHAMASLALILQTLTGQPVPATLQLLIKGAKGKMNEEGFSDLATAAAVTAITEQLLQIYAASAKERLA